MKDAAAIIVAGGKGLRFGGRVRKQYLSLQGHPILWWSLRAFQKSPSIAEIILVVPAKDLKRLKRLGAARVVAGGSTRAASVREGLKSVSPGIGWVAVHDAVRPLVSPELIERTLAEARRHQAAIAACPSKDTVKLADARGRIAESPPRERVWLAQTPQAFERKLLERAHRLGHSLAATDDSQLVERLGVKVRLVEASPENLKITHPADLVVAQIILKNGKER